MQHCLISATCLKSGLHRDSLSAKTMQLQGQLHFLMEVVNLSQTGCVFHLSPESHTMALFWKAAVLEIAQKVVEVATRPATPSVPGTPPTPAVHKLLYILQQALQHSRRRSAGAHGAPSPSNLQEADVPLAPWSCSPEPLRADLPENGALCVPLASLRKQPRDEKSTNRSNGHTFM